MTGDYNIVPTARDGLLSAHNQFLQLTIEGGLVSLFVFCLTAFFVPVKLFKERKNDAAKVISIGIFSIALVLFSEDGSSGIQKSGGFGSPLLAITIIICYVLSSPIITSIFSVSFVSVLYTSSFMVSPGLF